MGPLLSEATILKGGQVAFDPRLGRVREVDIRNLNYPVLARLEAETLHKPRSYTWRIDERLDQGAEGSCVGHAWAHELAARPAEVENITHEFAKEKIYWEAQKEDEWEGGAYPNSSPFYEGTSVRAGGVILKRLGLISEFRWAFHMHEFIAAVAYKGPGVIGVDWYAGMFQVDANGFIHPTGYIGGGHCVAVVAVKIYLKDPAAGWTYDNIDWLRSYFVILNSWGREWGVNGMCKITLIEFLKLWPGGDFAIPIGRTKTGLIVPDRVDALELAMAA